MGLKLDFLRSLHLLVNFAECASPAIKEFDALYKDQGESDHEKYYIKSISSKRYKILLLILISTI
jgi:hypothetical protein